MKTIIHLHVKLLLTVVLLMFLPWIPKDSFADKTTLKVPFSLKWNIAEKDSVIEQVFVVNEYKIHLVLIGFHHSSATDINQLWKFTGDGSFQYITKDPVNPVVVTASTPEEVARRYVLFQKGVYTTRQANPGVVVPVHIKIEKYDSAGITTTLIDKTINTGGVFSGGNGSIDRMITTVKLRPGKYRIIANTLQECLLPSNVETYLIVGALPKSRKFKDSE